MEAAPKTSSRKRKQSSDQNPFAGILTRRKSQKFFFHQNRSGKSRRSRSFPSSLANPNLRTGQKLKECVRNDDGVVDDDEVCNVSIKDLRARRVFSTPPKLGGGNGENVSPELDSESIVSQLVENGGQFNENVKSGKNPNLSVMGKIDSGVECNGEGLNGGNPNLLISEKCVDSGVDFDSEGLSGGNPNLLVSEKCVDLKEGLNEGSPNLSMLGKCLDFKGESFNGGNPNLSIEVVGAKNVMSPNLSGKDMKGRSGDQSMEDVQTTPPDAVVLVRSSDSRMLPKRISPSKGEGSEGKKSFFNSRKNLVLNPCSKMKVFKTPNSFSYRRMLPFLMDMKKDTPSAPKVNQRIKIETDVEGKPVVSSTQESIIDRAEVDEKTLDIIVTCKPQETNTVINEEEKVLLDPKSTNPNYQQASPCTPISCLVEKSLENPLSDEQTVTPVSDCSNDGVELPDRQCSSDYEAKSGEISPTVSFDLAAPLHSPKISTEPSKVDATPETPPHASLDGKRDCSAALVECKSEALSISVYHSPSKQEAILSADVHGTNLGNGILKKNPRGCRGICNCLNCASFRLNAEKAFEFSRNQLLDTEELAMDLMKELSNLKCMLEKSVTGADDNAIVPIDQVQEFCRRASNAEVIARSRLSQMNEDLHVHCRTKPLQRPRVTFSSSSHGRN